MVKIGAYEVKTELLYWDNFIWTDRISDTELRIGITDYGQQTLKDITAISPPSKGARLHKKNILFSIESISRDFDVKSPVSCIVLNINDDIIASPDLLNEDPYKNWIVHVDCLELKDLDLLIDGDDMADIILEETGSSDDDIDSVGDDFDYENEFAIDSTDNYYNEPNSDDLSNNSDIDDEFNDDW